MFGTANATQLQNIVGKAQSFGIVSGTSGQFSLSFLHSLATAGFAATEAGAAWAPLNAGQTALVDAAIKKSNAAALMTPSAGTGKPTTARTPTSIIEVIAKGLSDITSLPEDIRAMEAGATATLNCWGWTLDLNESATLAFEHILGNDISTVASVLAALASGSAPIAAAAAIIAAASTGLDEWMKNADSSKKGVTLKGYLFVGVWVEGN